MRKYKLLVVEDNEVDQLAFKRIVDSGNLAYDYTIAGSVAEARELLNRNDFEVIIADYFLGDGTAFDLFEAAREIPIIIATGTGDEEIAVRAMKSGAYDYLIKDLVRNYLKVLPATVDNAIRWKRSADQNKILSHAVMSISDSVFITDENDRIILTNSAFSVTYGYDKEEVIGKPTDFLWVEQSGQAPAPTPHQDIVEGEFFSRRKDGSVFPIILSRSVITDDKGTKLACLGVIRDITRRKRTEEDLRESRADAQRYATHLEKRNRELDQFAHVISHDLKAPLRAINSLSQWIEEDLDSKLSGETREHMDLLQKRVLRMNALIEGLLQYSRIGRLEDTCTQVAVATLLQDIIDSLSPPTGFKVIIQPGMPQLDANQLQLSQVFTNLIGNALQHHDRKKGQVEIGVEDSGDDYTFSVSDDGPGIDPAFHDKVFEIFQTLEPPDKAESTGIGLALVKKIVEEQGGMVELRSRKGRGTTFRFTWPKKPR